MISPFQLIGVGLVTLTITSNVEALNNINRPAEIAGSITPIIDDPIPAWASSNDVCTPKSCDDCPVTASQYCEWSLDGKSHCCARREQTNGQSIFESFASLFSGILGSDEKVSIGKATVEPVEQQPESAKVVPVPADQEVQPESGAVMPIRELKPQWASASDYCIGTDGCDSCPSQGYCTYEESGAGTCCVKSSDKALLTPSVSASGEASITPITENPIPAGASASELLCSKQRSCSMCKTEQYCNYTPTGIPVCCTLSPVEISKATVAPSIIEPQPESAKVGPIPADQEVLPESGAILPIKDQQTEPESGSVMPIKDQYPSWASPNDVCAIMSCDKCGSHQYCDFTPEGIQMCCGSMIATL